MPLLLNEYSFLRIERGSRTRFKRLLEQDSFGSTTFPVVFTLSEFSSGARPSSCDQMNYARMRTDSVDATRGPERTWKDTHEVFPLKRAKYESVKMSNCLHCGQEFMKRTSSRGFQRRSLISPLKWRAKLLCPTIKEAYSNFLYTTGDAFGAGDDLWVLTILFGSIWVLGQFSLLYSH